MENDFQKCFQLLTIVEIFYSQSTKNNLLHNRTNLFYLKTKTTEWTCLVN